MTLYDGARFTIPEAPGHTFKVLFKQDDVNDSPWERDDFCGQVRSCAAWGRRPTKRPGERLLYTDRGDHWFYDWAGTMERARKEGWGVAESEYAEVWRKNGKDPSLCPHKPPPGMLAAEAVQRDFDRSRRFLQGDWCFIGVCVVLVNQFDEPTTNPYEYALWGIESDCEEYIEETARDLALQLATDKCITLEHRRQAWRQALHETRERRYWASRDIATLST